MVGGRLALPIGVDFFKEIREGGYYFVDKSELISDILDQRKKVYLFTRPRRFGKSLNLSMIDCFFNSKYKGNTWFDGLKVMEHPDAVAMMSSRPVIRMDMKGLDTESFESFQMFFSWSISRICVSFEYLLESDAVPETDKDVLRRGMRQSLNKAELGNSLSLLCRMLNIHHGTAPIVLIDEYDSPINNSFGHDSYEPILNFLRMFYSSTFKGNEDLGFAVVTGVMQIAKETIFSGLNNLSVNNIFSKDFDERYGFTSDEVKDLCTYYGRPEAFETAKEWYDGYRFGNAEIYNPWSVLNFIGSRFEPGPYWAGTSGNSIIDTLLDYADKKVLTDLETLANGGSISASLTPTVAMRDLRNDTNAIYSVMAVAGYLNAVPYGKTYNLSIPNREMFGVFADFIGRRVAPGAGGRFSNLFNGLARIDLDMVRNSMQAILDDDVPFILLTDEKTYQLIIGAAAMSLLGKYTVKLEPESGDGRADITMVPNRPGLPNVILELKLSSSENEMSLQHSADEGLDQIKERQYFRQMRGRTLLYGMSFHSKRFGLAFEELDLHRSRSPLWIGTHDISDPTGGRPLPSCRHWGKKNPAVVSR